MVIMSHDMASMISNFGKPIQPQPISQMRFNKDFTRSLIGG